jgi:hypothetical protein
LFEERLRARRSFDLRMIVPDSGSAPVVTVTSLNRQGQVEDDSLLSTVRGQLKSTTCSYTWEQLKSATCNCTWSFQPEWATEIQHLQEHSEL